jgi:hypothetical protein
VAGQRLARRQLAAHDAIAELASDLFAHGFRVIWDKVEEQWKSITVHIRYIQ